MSEQLDVGDKDRSAALRRAWELSLHMLVTKFSKVTFETWIRPIQPLKYEGDNVLLGVASPYARESIEKKAINAIRSALEFHLDTSGLEVTFVVLTREQQDAFDKIAAAKKSESRPPNPAQPALPLDGDIEHVPESPAETTPPTRTRRSASRRNQEPLPVPCLSLNEQYVFDNFITGRSNRLAHAGSLNVAAKPGDAYNPLFLYGGPGLGKTHLLQGIAHTLRRTNPSLRVSYVSGEYFAQHYISALREHTTDDFRRQYREVDVWLVDDVQFIAGKEHTKEEFFHTFKALSQNNKQIVIASDRSPRDLNTMDERLRSRFQSGLIADIGAPELETRIAILQQRKIREQAEVPDDVLVYIASAIQSNIRALEGALVKLLASSSVMNVPVSAELAQSVLSEYFIEKPIRYRRVTVDEVVEAVGAQFGTTSAAIKGPSRNKDVSLARHVAMYICRELMPEVNTMLTGAAFGGRDHATIVYACQKVKVLMGVDSELQAMIKNLIKSLPR